MKILFEYKNKFYKFLNIVFSDDGSLYISVDRKIINNKSMKSFDKDTWKDVDYSRKPRKISYHTTGRVNYHGLFTDDSPSFFEPLVDITEENFISAISIPNIIKLDEYQGDFEETAIISLKDEELDRFTIGISIAPSNSMPESNVVILNFKGNISYDIRLFPSQNPVAPTADHFVYVKPNSMHDGQLIGRFAAELAYIQGEGSIHEMIVHGPNGEGVYTLYFAVEMRCAPKIEIALVNRKDEVRIVDNSKPHKLKFKILTSNGFVKDRDLRPFIKTIILDAEIY